MFTTEPYPSWTCLWDLKAQSDGHFRAGVWGTRNSLCRPDPYRGWLETRQAAKQLGNGQLRIAPVRPSLCRERDKDTAIENLAAACPITDSVQA